MLGSQVPKGLPRLVNQRITLGSYLSVRPHGSNGESDQAGGLRRGKSCDPNTPLQPGQIMLSSPDPVSQCHHIKFYRPPNETRAEREYRELREQAQDLHHNFWYATNQAFARDQAQFIAQACKQHPDLQTIDMAPFYRDFHAQSYARHRAYNRRWWYLNLCLLRYGARAAWDSWRLRSDPARAS
ncbi:hypothetical protein H4R34_002095 [Dimargaris verticillata]|uniref:Apoptogenic protein 1, mitochondrial n=1 Tax=Dimargaris verticillata TaxID=2761393 RepID=A0A9W8EEE3_9FUNG|nr:hypothetical protein H4R34_002095 [Dimargaris verticillata]